LSENVCESRVSKHDFYGDFGLPRCSSHTTKTYLETDRHHLTMSPFRCCQIVR